MTPAATTARATSSASPFFTPPSKACSDAVSVRSPIPVSTASRHHSTAEAPATFEAGAKNPRKIEQAAPVTRSGIHRRTVVGRDERVQPDAGHSRRDHDTRQAIP